MGMTSVLFAFVAICIGLMSTYFIYDRLSISTTSGRFFTIDGLRGYLAFFVFLHHSCIWYYYLGSGVWANPPNRVFVHFGQIGVSLFFMITGFLFFSKMLDSRKSGVDWLRLYSSRFLRLTPLYVFSMSLLFLVVFVVTRHEPVRPAGEVIVSILKWLAFTIRYGSSDINGMVSTNLINASVAWSLPYEWTFYIALPLVFAAIGGRTPLKYLLFSVLCMYAFGHMYFVNGFYWLFVGGMIAAVVVRLEAFKVFSASRFSSCIILFLLAFIVVRFSAVYDSPVAKTLLVIVFCLIAGGNSIFGLLESKVSRAMGEMAYSIYLLHGILLFVVFKFVIGFSVMKQVDVLQYWCIILVLTPVLIFLCGLTFSLVERPSMRVVNSLVGWIRGRKLAYVNKSSL